MVEETKTMPEIMKEIENMDFSQEKIKTEEKLFTLFLPVEGKLISDFASEVGKVIALKKTLFFRPSSNDIIEVSNIKEDESSEEYVGFSSISPERFITVAEKYFVPSTETVTKNGSWIRRKSMSSSLSKAVLCSPQMQDALPKIKRIFNTPIPIIYNGVLCFPKKGYDERFLSWMPYDSPQIRIDMSLDDAKALLVNLYKEFCFKEKQDYINAISALLTPFLKGLYPSFNTRSPLFFYMANRERAGKDYCADITGLVHEGNAIQEPPICNGERNGNNNEELRKKILSAMIAGRKRLHFANNRGYIDNAVFEGIITAEKYSDRALGRNEILTLDNEMDFSLSGNVGVGFTADIANRSRFIRLFLDIEDANARKFNNPNLHNWVKENRGEILSALYALVRNWVEKGMPQSNEQFASFPEWARICGGIMESAGYNSPCVADSETLAVGGDEETKDMKILFEMCYEQFHDKWVKKFDIKELVRLSDETIFAYLDFSKKADQTKFGMKVTKFVGRVMSDIILKVKDPKMRAARQEFMFTKDKIEENKENIFGNLGNIGNPCIPIYVLENNIYTVGDKLPTLPTLPSSNNSEVLE
jgi:hypothetical protein